MSPDRPRLRIGTRASALARWQAEFVASSLRVLPGAPEPELVLIRTEGDRIQDIPLSQVEGKAFFTKEIEEALLNHTVDLAVHSLKDLATEMPPGLALGAVLEREDPRDALLSAGPDDLEDLPRGARVGTSSLRRRALLARWRPDLELAELRGNVPTRIRRLDEGSYDAIVLAAAGVKRLQMQDRISSFLPFERFLPAVSQGAIGIQIRSGDEEVARWVGELDSPATRFCTTAERALLRTLEGGCHVPVGAFADLDGDTLRLRGVVCSLDGSRSVEGTRSGPPGNAGALGIALAQDLLARGGDEILDAIRKAGGGR
ncbi:MAG: hydroxymethylbilane synthase [Longimicrobiales bacterium]